MLVKLACDKEIMNKESGEVAVAARPKRGRPKKAKTVTAMAVPVPVRKRGRPKKVKMNSIDESTTRTLTPRMQAVYDLFAEDSEDESTTMTPTLMRKSRESSFSPFTCSHCNKRLANAYGLQYHVENFVCRPFERPGGPVKLGRRPNFVCRSSEPSVEPVRSGRHKSDGEQSVANADGLNKQRGVYSSNGIPKPIW